MFDRFFIAGAQRSGTTYLWQVLDEHPEIEMARPLRPEPKFFLVDALYEQGLAYYESRFFSGELGARVRGEKSTSYMESEKAAVRIAQCFATARIVFLLRDPIKRAISNYWFSVANGLESLPIAEAFRREEERWQQYDSAQVSASPYAYLRRGRYVDFIEVYERHFPAQQLVVVLYEQLIGNITALRALYGTLGVSSNFVPPSLNGVVNAGDGPATALASDLEAALQAYYSESNARLAARFGLDLACWRHFR